jgi:hypothetical protein
MTERPAFIDLWVAFNLAGFGLMLALIGLLIFRNPSPIASDIKTEVAASIGALGLFLVIASARLVWARSEALQYAQNLQVDTD